jgi:ribonuclease P protein component
MRRRVYEIVRHELPRIPLAHDVAIMIFSSEVINLPAQELTETIQQLFEQADLYKS